MATKTGEFWRGFADMLQGNKELCRRLHQQAVAEGGVMARPTNDEIRHMSIRQFQWFCSCACSPHCGLRKHIARKQSRRKPALSYQEEWAELQATCAKAPWHPLPSRRVALRQQEEPA